ncbi:hypothetical protein [Lysobacter enzymogenes]|uniref:hypothetical protein n=1 Tax=Lysobacter enzymogenes TaxID=69 RepID=UPI001AFC6B30|nr:hypothetical protein [Lysobacter enzymogenes]QQQ00742.1 hypothetical protein JHW41_22145 [Lysobacter enzymogenes]
MSYFPFLRPDCRLKGCGWLLMPMLIAASGCSRASGDAGPDWRSIDASMKSSPQVDIASVAPHENGWAAWTRSPVYAVDIPKGLAVPLDSKKWVRMHVDCRESSADVAFIEARLVAPSGAILHAVKKGEAGADDYPSAGRIPYAISPPAMICAAAAARCRGDALTWPLERGEQTAFVPSCRRL